MYTVNNTVYIYYYFIFLLLLFRNTFFIIINGWSWSDVLAPAGLTDGNI